MSTPFPLKELEHESDHLFHLFSLCAKELLLRLYRNFRQLEI